MAIPKPKEIGFTVNVDKIVKAKMVKLAKLRFGSVQRGMAQAFKDFLWKYGGDNGKNKPEVSE